MTRIAQVGIKAIRSIMKKLNLKVNDSSPISDVFLSSQIMDLTGGTLPLSIFNF